MAFALRAADGRELEIIWETLIVVHRETALLEGVCSRVKRLCKTNLTVAAHTKAPACS